MKTEKKTKGWMDLVAIIAVLGIGYFAIAFTLGTFQPIGAVVSGSMEPVLSRGDLVILRNVPPSELRVGDIAQVQIPRAFQEEFGLPPNNLHRITDIVQTGNNVQFITKGDANANIDPIPVAPDRVGGIVVADVPQLGHLFLFLNSPQGRIFASIMAVAVVGYILFVGVSDNWRNVVVAAQTGAGTLSPEAAEQARIAAEGADPDAVPNTALAAEVDSGFTTTSQSAAPGSGISVAPTLAAADLRLMAGVADERLDGIESGITETRESLQHFSAAISEYGTHLQSHTATVRAMSTASESLVEAVDRQNTVLERLETTLDRDPDAATPAQSRRSARTRDGVDTQSPSRTASTGTRRASSQASGRSDALDSGTSSESTARPARRRATARRSIGTAGNLDFRQALRKVSAKRRPAPRKRD